MSNQPEKPKLLQILSSIGTGGAEGYSLKIASSAKAKNWDVYVAFPQVEATSSLVQKYLNQGISYYPLSLSMASRINFKTLNSEFPNFLQTLFLLRKIKADAVHITLPWPDRGFANIMASAFFKKPTLVVFQLVPNKIRMSSRQIRAYEWAYKRNQTWVAVSNQNRKVISEIFHIPFQDIELVYNGARITENRCDDLQPKIAKKLREELNLPSESRLLLTVGRLDSQKGHIDIIPAIPHLVKDFPDIYFIWAGEGQLRQTLEQKVKEYAVSDRVFFLGHRSDIQELYQASDLFLFPSYFEGQPFALMEAMTFGLPIVSTSVSGIPEIIEHSIHGLLFRAGDSCDLLETVRFALNNPDLLKKMSLKAKSRINLFSEEKMIDETLGLLSSMLNT